VRISTGTISEGRGTMGLQGKSRGRSIKGKGPAFLKKKEGLRKNRKTLSRKKPSSRPGEG